MASGLFKQRHTHSFSTDFLIGELLVKAGIITQKQLEEAMRLAGHKHLHVGQMLIMCGYLTPQNLQAAIDSQSALRDRSIELTDAIQYLKIACKTGRSFADVARDQSNHKVGPSNKLGELLLEAGIISHEQFDKAMQRSLATGLPLGRILVLNGAISDSLLNVALDVQVKIRDGVLERSQALESLRLCNTARAQSQETEGFKEQAEIPIKPRKSTVKLGELLVIGGLLTETDVMNALETGLTNDQPIGQILVSQGFITPELLDTALKLQKLVDDGHTDVEHAGHCLSRVQTTGISVFQALGEIDNVQSDSKPIISFEKLLTLARIVTAEDIKSAFDWSTKSAQIIAKVLHMTGYMEEDVTQAALRCHYLLSKEWLGQDDAVVALDYYRRQHPTNRGTMDEVLQGLGWTANQTIQIEGEIEGENTVVSDLSSTLEHMQRMADEPQGTDIAGDSKAKEPRTETASEDKTSIVLPTDAGETVSELLVSPAVSAGADTSPGSMIPRTIAQEPLDQAVAQGSMPKSDSLAGATSKNPASSIQPDSGNGSKKGFSGMTGLGKLLASAKISSSQAADQDTSTKSGSAPRGGLGKLLSEAEQAGLPLPSAASAEPDKASSLAPKPPQSADAPTGPKDSRVFQDAGSSEPQPKETAKEPVSGTTAKPGKEETSEPKWVSTGKKGDRKDLNIHLVGAFLRLAESYCEEGHYPEAQQLYERILLLKENEYGAKNTAIVLDLNNLASVLCVQGKFNQSEPFIRRITSILESAEPTDPMKLADSVGMLASVYFQQGKFDACEPLFKRCLALKQQALGEDHPLLADTFREYAKLLMELSQEEEAEQYYARAEALLASSPKVG